MSGIQRFEICSAANEWDPDAMAPTLLEEGSVGMLAGPTCRD